MQKKDCIEKKRYEALEPELKNLCLSRKKLKDLQAAKSADSKLINSAQKEVNPDKIGIIGICGWGGMALNVAGIDTRIKATVVSTMYDMSRVTANGYFDSADSADARYEARI